MNSQTDQQLLGDYARQHSEGAFTELVRRHVDFVYSAALRMVRDAHLAEDVTQGVFVALAKNAGQLTDHPVLSGWLHRTTQNLAANVVRTDVRRRAREQEAVAMNELLATESEASWEHIAPQLDAALGELAEPDRDALLLRYFERKSAHEMALTLGVSDEAAQKRVTRAVERLREFFTKRGVTVGAGSLVAVVSANAVQAAPAGLAATLAIFSVTGVTASSTTLPGIFKIMALTKVKTAVATAIIVAGITTSLVLQQQAQARMRGQEETWQQQSDQLTKLKAEHDRLAGLAGQDMNSGINNLDSLLKLRAQVSGLRDETNRLAQLQDENRRRRAGNSQTPQGAKTPLETMEDEKELNFAKLNYTKQWILAFVSYAGDNKGQYPTNFDDATPYFSKENLVTNLSISQFELVYQGPWEAIKEPATTIVMREKQATSQRGQKSVKAYGYADGHSEIHAEPDGGFDSFEKKHILPKPN